MGLQILLHSSIYFSLWFRPLKPLKFCLMVNCSTPKRFESHFSLNHGSHHCMCSRMIDIKSKFHDQNYHENFACKATTNLFGAAPTDRRYYGCCCICYCCISSGWCCRCLFLQDRKNIIPERCCPDIISRRIIPNHHHLPAISSSRLCCSDLFGVFPHNLNQQQYKRVRNKKEYSYSFLGICCGSNSSDFYFPFFKL